MLHLACQKAPKLTKFKETEEPRGTLFGDTELQEARMLCVAPQRVAHHHFWWVTAQQRGRMKSFVVLVMTAPWEHPELVCAEGICQQWPQKLDLGCDMGS